MKTKIIFRADAGNHIGYGHFIRSLALADMLKDDFDIRFATVNPTDYQKNELSKVCPYIHLNQETHFEDFLSLLNGDEIVVLDNYFFTTDYQKGIKEKGNKLVCIDDIHDKHFVADIVINHGVNNPDFYSIENYTRLCLGIEWALLRKPFLEAAKNNRNRRKNDHFHNIVISFGGVDSYRLTDKYISFLQEINSAAKIDAIVGAEYSINSQYDLLKNITFHASVSAQTIADLFSQCDLAILSASTICMEAIACNTTVAAGYYVDNQEDVHQYLLNENLIIDLGNLLKNEKYPTPELFSNFPYRKIIEVDFNTIPDRYIHLFHCL